MTGSARANLGCVVRAGEGYQGKQGPNYTPGISAQSAGSQAIWLGSGTLPAHGGRTKAHLHENHESAIYLLSGDEVELWTGEQLEHREVAHPGDFLYIPAGVPPCGGQSQRDASHLRVGADRPERAGEGGVTARPGSEGALAPSVLSALLGELLSTP